MSRFSSSRAVRALGFLAVAALVGGLAGRAGADHRFSDVPDTNAFHDAIGDVTDAGCATGFPAGTFRPNSEVKRGQMARFLATCSGRAAYDAGDGNVGTDEAAVATASITAGAVGDGAGFILATGSVSMSTAASGANLPCEGATASIQDGRGAREVTFVDLVDTGQQFEDDNVALTFMVPAAAGETVDIQLFAGKGTCTAGVTYQAWLTALYVPFDGAGNGGGAAGTPALPSAGEPERG